MKKVTLSLILGIMLIGIIGFTVAIPYPGSIRCNLYGGESMENDQTVCILADGTECDPMGSEEDNWTGDCILYASMPCAELGDTPTENSCCEGLVAIKQKRYFNSDCEWNPPAGYLSTCSNCGDGVCDDNLESSCNCPADCKDNETEISKPQIKKGIGQTIRNKVKAGVYTSPEGVQIRVRELAQNRIQFFNGNYTIQSELNLTQEQDQNRTRLKVKLNNGRNAEIKIMPNVASEKALARLRLRSCNGSENCSIELKEVGEGNRTRLVYEAKARKTFKIFGFIKNREEVMTQIDAETGEEIKGRRPWWAWMASEADEADVE